MARNRSNPNTRAPVQGIKSVQEISATIANTSVNAVTAAILCNPRGVVRAECTLASNVAGTFSLQTGSSANGTFYPEPIPVVSKVAGTNIASVPLTIVEPGAYYVRAAWNASTGSTGDHLNATINIASW